MSLGQHAATIDVHQADAIDAPGRWYVLHTRSRQEKALAHDLAAMQVAVFLPTMRTIRYYGRRKVRVELPLFPNYLFLRGSLDQAYAADRTRRLANIIPVANQQQLDGELRTIHDAIIRGANLAIHPRLVRGVRVQVTAGPFKGLRGQIEQEIRADRLVLQVQTLGQASSLEIDASLLSPIDPLDNG